VLASLAHGANRARVRAWSPGHYALHAYVTPGDAQWDSRYPPLDSPATVAAFFEQLAGVQRVSRVYWRGEQNLNCLKNYVFPRENPQRYEHWTQWQRYLNVDLELNRAAEREAHRRGVEIFMMEGLFDFGGPGDAEYSDPLPYYGEDRIRKEHPEWIPVDRWGDRRQAGPLELAYPAARRALTERFTRNVIDGGYDGLFLYTYFENYSTRFEDEFGFNDPIVDEYRRRYGVDIRTAPFDRGRWGDLRGEYVTEFLRGLHETLAARGKKLTISLSANAPDRIQDWPMNQGRINSSIRLDWRTWVARGIVDEVAIMGGTDAAAIDFAEQVLALGRPAVAVTILTESPLHPRFVPLLDRGVTVTGWSAPYRGVMEQFSMSAPTTEDLTSGDWKVRAQAAVAVAARTLTAPSAAVAALVRDPHVLVRREAIRALVATGARDGKAAIEAALKDPEESVRIAAVVALGAIGDADSASAIAAAVAASPRFMVKEAAVQALAKLGRPVMPVLLDALRSPSAPLRQVGVRALGALATPEDVPTLLRVAGTDADEQVRYYAIEALQRWPEPSVATFLLAAAALQSPTLQMTAIRGIESVARVLSAEQKQHALLLLKDLFAQYGNRSVRSDADWGWRVVSRALLALGDEGTRALEEFRVQRADLLIARRAYYALHVKQREGQYMVSNWDEDEQLHTGFWPGPPPVLDPLSSRPR
jgi:HEAT repeat protein